MYRGVAKSRKEAKALTAPMFADTVFIPAVTGVTMPAESTVATKGFPVVQMAVLVTSCCDPSVKVPMAVARWGTPTKSVPGTVTASETNVGAVIVNRVLPLIGPEDAVMVLVPWLLLV